ncbi:MAG: PIN domain-containing protein [Ignavibacteriaceae bacterium]|nr:PIN domain-containing protein [Ignavibacteriaceae bacterium]
MKRSKNEFLVDTSILIEHLECENEFSILEAALTNSLVFTTVINASELFVIMKNRHIDGEIKSLLSVINVLGIHSRYSLGVPIFSDLTQNYSDAIFCVVAQMNKLPILTFNEEKYKNTGLKIYNGLEVINDFRQSDWFRLVNS